MTEHIENCLLERQRELEENAIGLGLARAARIISGERTQEEVDAFGGDKTDGIWKRKYAFLYLLATEGMSKLTGAIAKRRDICGDKSKKTYKVLAQCGTDAEVAGVVIKAVFTALCIGTTNKDDDDDGDDDEPGVYIATIAKEVAEMLYSLYLANKRKKQRKTKCFKRSAAPKKEKPAPSSDMLEKLALELILLYLKNTEYYHRNPGSNQLEMTDAAVSALTEEIILERHRDNTVILNADADQQLVATHMVSPRWPPVLVPPKPWKSIVEGGYWKELSTHVALIKKCRKRDGLSMKKCPEVFKALNRLQETPFKINHCVFSAFSSLFTAFTTALKSERIADVGHAKRYEILLDLPEGKLSQYKSYFFRKKYWGQYSGLYVEAKSFLNDRFYFVHDCDFRGRVYPKASSLNYQSGDLRRSLLVFGDAKPIRGEAERWLKRHGANCYAEKNEDTGRGIDKSSFEERESWVDANEETIFTLGRLAKAESIFDKLTAELEDWWLEADKPWGFLAWAHEWTCYKENPDEHLSCLPVDVDGSSNGYQHIAALLRYKKVAAMVNMLPMESPNDIYSAVSNHTNEEIKRYAESKAEISCLWREYQDIEQNSEQSQLGEVALECVKKRILAVSLKKELPRSVAKKIIMTYPYSATLYSMAQKLKKERGIFENWTDRDTNPEYFERHPGRKTGFTPVFPDGFDIDASIAAQKEEEAGDTKIRRILSETLASAICECIGKSFPSVPGILNWFKQIGDRASGILENICWESPSMFPVQQHYEKQSSKRISTLGAKFMFKKNTGKTNKQKHANAFGPNFIHSCDAAHLIKTVNSAHKCGITSFRMVHDSYATHAADMEKLFGILREEFINMYAKTNILDDLRGSIIRQCDGRVEIDPAPMVDDLDISQIRDALYFFA